MGLKVKWNPIRDIKKGAENLARETKKGVDNVVRETGKGVGNVAREADKGASHVAGEVGKGLDNVARETAKGVSHAAGEVGRGVENLGNFVEKAAKDTEAEAKRAGRNVNKLAIASGTFLESQVHGLGQSFEDAGKRVREGKLVDAIWHVATDPVRYTEKSAAAAMAESNILRFAASVAANAYGGPGGAAAFAAWFAYRQTGDLGLALKVGVIAGATSKGLKLVDGMPGETADELTRKVIASGAIGGAAVAASGGDEDEALKGFVTGAAAAGLRETYKKVAGEYQDGKLPAKGGVAKQSDAALKEYGIVTDEHGQPVLDANGRHQVSIRSIGRTSVSHVGLVTGDANAPLLSGAETSLPMEAVSKIPYINDLGYFHDQWAELAGMQGIAVQATIVPALAVTVGGAHETSIQRATEEAVEGKRP